ncbi:MAG: polysaccharide deacetylase family protein [Pirellulaceae bacterium]
MSNFWLPTLVVLVELVRSLAACAAEAVPDKLVVLTFDDASRSHFTVARPLLLKYGFGATFFVTEGWDFATNPRDYMTWEQIAQLHRDGFEIGNHTRDHQAVTAKSLPDLPHQVQAINARCQEHGIPQPVSFAYPGNAFTREALPVLRELGFLFARRGVNPEYAYAEGRGPAYEPGLDDPLLIPTTGDARPAWSLANLQAAVAQARQGRIAVLQFHGVPDTAHDWVSTPAGQFEKFLQYLADKQYRVIALRDLARYVDPRVAPRDPEGVIEDRKSLIAAQRDGMNARPPRNDDDLRYWLHNSLVSHRFAPSEAGAALGLTGDEVVAAAARLDVDLSRRPVRRDDDALLVLPYPGGRHPRIGFRDGAIRPQRETKASIFAPWLDGGYVVADVPEAVWYEPGKDQRELLYLAHTHVPTTWTKQGTELPALEWQRQPDGGLSLERTLPNNVTLATLLRPAPDGVHMEFRVTNGSPHTLTGLRVQMCVMLARLTGFESLTNDNKVFEAPFAACHDRTGERWVITAWQRCGRAWGNPPCPCFHSDPVIEDCPPGATRGVRGWVSFYTGTDISAELNRLAVRGFE